MKKYLLFSLFALFTFASFAQDSTAAILPNATQKTLSKADSFFAAFATKQHIDTNASAEVINNQVDEVISLIPGKHSGPLKWLSFLIALLMLIDYAYFWVKHRVGSIKALFNGKAAAIILLLLCTAGLQAQTIRVEIKEKYYHRQSVVKKKPAKKVVKAQGGTKLLLASMVDISTLPTSGTIIYSTPSFGLGGLAIQKSVNGWEATGTVDPSVSYSIGVGEYNTNSDGSLTIEPYVNAGAFMAAGIIPNASLQGSLQLGGAVGIYKYNSLAIGYDVLTHKPFFALGASVSLFTFKKGLGSSIIHLF